MKRKSRKGMFAGLDKVATERVRYKSSMVGGRKPPQHASTLPKYLKGNKRPKNGWIR